MKLLDKIECVIFDMDGVMFDTERLAEKIWLGIFKEYKLLPNKTFMDSIKGRNISDSKKLFEQFYGSNIDFIELKNLRDQRLEYELRCNGVPLKNGLIETLNYLKANNKKIALASSSNKKLIMDNLKDTKLTNYFDYIVSGEDFRQSKPNPEIFLNCSNHFNISVDKCLVIEDSKAGVDAALNAKMQVIWIPDLVLFEVSKDVIKLESLNEIKEI